MEKILVIVPVYNEEATIVNTVKLLEQIDFVDYIVVNDGSTDRTLERLREYNFNFINLSTNLGIGGAVQTGYRYALKHGYDYAIQLDADGQHNPRDLLALYREMVERKCDMVIGSRFVKKTGYRGEKSRRFGIYFFYRLIFLLTGKRITDPTSGYRLVNRKVIEEFAAYYPVDYPEVEVLVLLFKKGFDIREISVEMNERQGGTSSINLRRAIYYMIKVTIFSIIRKAF
ncbi:glycosyltransferase family 2 protein [Paenibacillus sp.]|uniref:glycosyltransferase family 2 protein n=1 Tax=Paenibacillus sp. TaxID=58172 RepID=UPI002D41B3A9|nr:glycosyltransferase family 2 protein [Paenibacillus sp.]HZG86185.1 glycosyltransferase family 2 protein [Paenibacillus sp.]